MSTDKNITATDSGQKMVEALRTKVRARLGELRISAREASRRAGFNVGYVGDLLEGRSKTPEANRIIRLAEALEIPVDELLSDKTIDRSFAPPRASDSGAAKGLVPLFAAAVQMNVPFVPLSLEPVGSVPTLPTLELVEGAYAVTVFNDMNAPRYFAGETVYVSPGATIKPGDFTFCRWKNGTATIGRLIEIGEKVGSWLLLNPGKSEERVNVDLEEVMSFHRIVGSVG